MQPPFPPPEPNPQPAPMPVRSGPSGCVLALCVVGAITLIGAIGAARLRAGADPTPAPVATSGDPAAFVCTNPNGSPAARLDYAETLRDALAERGYQGAITGVDRYTLTIAHPECGPPMMLGTWSPRDRVLMRANLCIERIECRTVSGGSVVATMLTGR